MKRILIKIAYDGTNYKGWSNGSDTGSIETLLNEKISLVCKEDMKIIGTSRTDSGVHANGNIAVFDTNSDIEPDKFFYVINNELPDDISVIESYEVPATFHPRKCDAIKTYIYRIHDAKVRNPLKEHNAHYVYYDIDINKMREGAKYLIGKHDFKSFINPDSQSIEKARENGNLNEETTTREIYKIDIEKIDDIIEIRISGNGFLYHMVRIIAGTLLKVGMKMWEPAYVGEILTKRDRKFAGFTLPAKGLTLEKIEFV